MPNHYTTLISKCHVSALYRRRRANLQLTRPGLVHRAGGSFSRWASWWSQLSSASPVEQPVSFSFTLMGRVEARTLVYHKGRQCLEYLCLTLRCPTRLSMGNAISRVEDLVWVFVIIHPFQPCRTVESGMVVNLAVFTLKWCSHRIILLNLRLREIIPVTAFGRQTRRCFEFSSTPLDWPDGSWNPRSASTTCGRREGKREGTA